MAARHEQIGQGAGHQQAMGILVEPAVAHLGKAEHPLDDPDRMLDPGAYLGLGTVFRPLDLIHHTAMAIAAIGEISGPWCMLADQPPAGRDRPDPPTPGSRCRATNRAAPCCQRHWPAWR